MGKRKTMAFVAAILAATKVFALELTGVVAPVDGAESFGNPGCGLAGGSWGSAPYPGMPTNGVVLCNGSANCTKLWSLHKFSKGYMYNGDYDYYTNHIERFVGGADIPLDANTLLSISNSLLSCRANGGTCIPRFAYTWDGWGGAEPDDFEMVLTHIEQLSAVLSQFRDVVPAVECGIIGAYGEMHTSRYTAREYQNRVIDAWLSGLPENMALLVRSPPVWMRYLDTTTQAFVGGGMDSMDQSLRARMGFYNDGYLGTDYDYGTWGGGGGSTTWSRSEGRTFLKGQAVPYGGEFAGISSSYFDANVHLLDPSRFNIVEEWYDTHLSYLRTIRSYGMTIVQKMTNTFFSSSAWAFDGMPNLSEYDGIDLRKFCEDHMGYRFVVRGVHAHTAHGESRKSKVESPGGPRSRAAATAVLNLEIENTGFGQLLFDEMPEVLLVPADGGAANALPVSAETSATFASIRGGTMANVTLAFPYPADTRPGDYAVYLRLRAPLADETAESAPRRVVRFANANGYDSSLKANYLCSVTLDEFTDIVPEDLWFAHREATGSVYGGRWTEGMTTDGNYRKRDFCIDAPLPQGKSGLVELELSAEISGGILDAEPGIAGFIFLADEHGDIPLPYGYTASGWTRLYGRSFTEGEAITLKIFLDSNLVSYEAAGTILHDAGGKVLLPAGGRTRATSSVSIVGDGETGDLIGRYSSDRRVPTVLFVR